MTDSEKELRRLAEAATPGPWRRAGTESKPCPVVSALNKEKGYQIHSMLWVKRDTPAVYDGMRDVYNRDAAFIAAANPAAVLALLDRIKELEGQLSSIAATLEYEGPVDGLAQAVKDYAKASIDAYVSAERRGAEEMRDAADTVLFSGEPGDSRMDFSERIRALPLPGDAP